MRKSFASRSGAATGVPPTKAAMLS
jgi:hypothetical protein